MARVSLFFRESIVNWTAFASKNSSEKLRVVFSVVIVLVQLIGVEIAVIILVQLNGVETETSIGLLAVCTKMTMNFIPPIIGPFASFILFDSTFNELTNSFVSLSQFSLGDLFRLFHSSSSINA